MLAVLALLAVTIVAMITLQALAGRWWVHEQLERESRDLAAHFVSKFNRRSADPQAAVDDLIEMAFHDPHVAFIAIRDADGRVAHSRIRDRDAFAGFERAIDGCPQAICQRCEQFPLAQGRGPQGHATSGVLWTDGQEVFGVVTIGVVDPAYHAAGMQLVRAGVAAGLLVGAISIPLVAMGARRLTAPLRRVSEAAESLAAGRRPEPLRFTGPREVDSLAASFNRMALALDLASTELQQANERLESTVQRRTHELRRVNARLELELDERARFFRAMSHDLAAPLRNIAGTLILLRRRHADLLPEEALEGLDRVERGIELELDMIRELLEITRLGATEERPEPVETLALAREVAHTFHHDLRTRRIELAVLEPMPVIRAEGARFRQALQNLVDNAIKYMGEREPRRIVISARLTDQAAEFTVADTGPGIPPREHDTIFEVFRRASNAPPGVKGSGVGLAAVKAIVQRWGGDIRIESVEGEGARFVFTVPAERLVTLPEPASENAPRAVGP